MSEVESSLKTILKGTRIIFIGIILSKILGYVYRVIVARVGTEEYGLISIGIAILGLLTTFSLMGLNDGVLRYVSFYKGKKNLPKIKEILSSALRLATPLSLIFAVLLFIFSNWISINLFHDARLNIILKLIAIVIPLNTLREIFLTTIRAFQKVKYEVYSKHITENLTKVIFSLIFVFLSYNFLGLAVAYVIAIFLSFLLALYFLKKKVIDLKPTELLKNDFNTELISYSFPLLFSSLIFSVILWMDTLMLGYFTNAHETGLYNAALPTSTLMFILPLTLLTLFIPVLTELYAQNKHDVFKSIYKIVTKWIFTANLILLGFFYLFSKPILEILFGSIYASASIPLIILSTGYFIGYSMSSTQDVMMIFKRTKLIFFNTILMAVMNLILNIILIPLYGITGAAIATASAFVTRSLLLFVEIKFLDKLNPLKLNYFKILFSIILATLLVKYVQTTLFPNVNILVLILGGILLTATYLLFLIITKTFEKADIQIIKLIQQKTGMKLNSINNFIRRIS